MVSALLHEQNRLLTRRAAPFSRQDADPTNAEQAPVFAALVCLRFTL